MQHEGSEGIHRCLYELFIKKRGTTGGSKLPSPVWSLCVGKPWSPHLRPFTGESHSAEKKESMN